VGRAAPPDTTAAAPLNSPKETAIIRSHGKPCTHKLARRKKGKGPLRLPRHRPHINGEAPGHRDANKTVDQQPATPRHPKAKTCGSDRPRPDPARVAELPTPAPWNDRRHWHGERHTSCDRVIEACLSSWAGQTQNRAPEPLRPHHADRKSRTAIASPIPQFVNQRAIPRRTHPAPAGCIFRILPQEWKRCMPCQLPHQPRTDRSGLSSRPVPPFANSPPTRPPWGQRYNRRCSGDSAQSKSPCKRNMHG